MAKKNRELGEEGEGIGEWRYGGGWGGIPERREGGLVGPCARGTRTLERCSFDARTMGPIQATLKPISPDGGGEE